MTDATRSSPNGISPIVALNAGNDTNGRFSDITFLPIEILLDIFSLISANDIINVLSTCHSLRSFVRNERIWRDLCCRYGVRDLADFKYHDPDRTFYTVYTELLHTYGPLLGLWAGDNPSFGNVLEFRIISAGESQQRGWEGIIAEVWIMSEATPNTNPDGEDHNLADLNPVTYWETLRIELLPPSAEPRAEGHDSERTRLVRFSWITEGGVVTETSSTREPVRLILPLEHDFFVFTGRPHSLSSLVKTFSSPHPPFPRSLPTELWLNTERSLPRLVPHDEPMIDHATLISALRVESSLRVMYLSSSSDLRPHSIQVVPPAGKEHVSAFVAIHDPPSNTDGVIDMRKVIQSPLPEIILDTERRDATNPHYFSIFSPEPSARPETNFGPEDVRWTPRSLEGLWVVYDPRRGAQVVSVQYGWGRAQAWKITGDRNVPRGTMCWDIVTHSEAQEAPQRLLEKLKLAGVPRGQYRMYDGYGIDFVSSTIVGEVSLLVAIVGRDDIRMIWGSELDIWGPIHQLKRYRGHTTVPDAASNPKTTHVQASRTGAN